MAVSNNNYGGFQNRVFWQIFFRSLLSSASSLDQFLRIEHNFSVPRVMIADLHANPNNCRHRQP